MVERVEQEDANGCGIAVLAMLTGKSYPDVVRQFHGRDFREHGLGISDIWRYLWDRGYYLRVVYEGKAFEDQWPPPPFAAMHFAQVENVVHIGHAVYMDMKGTVVDPLTAGQRRLTDYPVVNQVVGVRSGPK
jgi:hypothetical protein